MGWPNLHPDSRLSFQKIAKIASRLLPPRQQPQTLSPTAVVQLYSLIPPGKDKKKHRKRRESKTKPRHLSATDCCSPPSPSAVRRLPLKCPCTPPHPSESACRATHPDYAPNTKPPFFSFSNTPSSADCCMCLLFLPAWTSITRKPVPCAGRHLCHFSARYASSSN